MWIYSPVYTWYLRVVAFLPDTLLRMTISWYLCCCQYHCFLFYLVVFQFVDVPVVFNFLPLDILVGSMSWLLWIVLPRKLGCTCHFKWWTSPDLATGRDCRIIRYTSLFSVPEPPGCFPEWLRHLHSTRLWEASLSAASAVLFFVNLFNDDHCDQCEVIPSL